MPRKESSKMENRIDVLDVILAYQKTKLRPVRKVYGDGVNCGCPLIVLARAAGVTPNPIQDFSCQAKDWADKIFGPKYAEGFIDGVDGNTVPLFSEDETMHYIRGNDDGLDVSVAIPMLTNPRLMTNGLYS